MASPSFSPGPYDVFFSYNRLDQAEIETYDRSLTAKSLKVCVDYRHQTPGRPWVTEVEQAIRDVSAIAVFYGPHGFGDTQTLEYQLALTLGKHVIPVILPGVHEDPPLSFLTLRTWVDLRRDPLDRLATAIRGEAVGATAHRDSSPCPQPRSSLWQVVSESCRARLEVIGRRPEVIDSRSYVPREQVETEIQNFLEGKCSAASIVGDSGVGKSTLALHLANRYMADGHLCAMFLGSELPASPDEAVRRIAQLLSGSGVAPEQFWRGINDECLRQNPTRRFILFIDAINEFNEGRGKDQLPGPADLIWTINQLIGLANRDYPAVKLIMTCRPETWRRAVQEQYRTDIGVVERAYLGGAGGTPLHRFTKDESRQAYDIYRTERNIQTSYDDLSEPTRYLLRDPFFLNLATRSYEHENIPKDLDAGEVFRRYLKTPKLKPLNDAIEDIIDEMFAGGEPGVVQRAVVKRDRSLRSRNSRLYEALDTRDQTSDGYRLTELNVIRQAEIDEADQFRFTYDRVVQYLLSRKLDWHIQELAKASPLTEAAVAIVRGNLSGSQRMEVVFGALQQTLLHLTLQLDPPAHAILLHQIASLDARGLNLVMSMLVPIASHRKGHGFKILYVLFQNFKAARPATFPVIEATHRILCDAEYRAWLLEHQDARNDHIALLYENFDWGFCHPDRNVSDVAVQYVFLLWSANETLEDAAALTSRMIGKITGFSRSLISGSCRRRLTKLAGLMILLLSELSNRSSAPLALEAARSWLRTLRRTLRFLGLLQPVMAPFLIGLLKSLPNPVNFDELRAYYKNRQADLPDFERVCNFLISDSGPADLEAALPKLSQSRSSWVLQMFTFALSAAWERSRCESDRDKSLAMIGSLAKSSDPIAVYCASVALYQINYLGHPNRKTMEMMRETAQDILLKHQERFKLGRSTYNSQIIGTFGKALNRINREDLLVGEDVPPKLTELEDLVKIALSQARKAASSGDEQLYLYICENLAELGILVGQKLVLPVTDMILRDLGMIHSNESPEARISKELQEKASKIILQSLANLRALHRQDVDRHLFAIGEAEGNHDLYYKVTNELAPNFRLATFYSWAIEQLMFHILTEYHEQIGKDIMRVFIQGARQKSAERCLWVCASQILDTLSRLST